MASVEAVYRYRGLNGAVVARQEIESAAELPSMDQTITLPDSGDERRYIVTSRFAPYTTLIECEGIRSAYTIVVESAYRQASHTAIL
jgi:hypothetical protein